MLFRNASVLSSFLLAAVLLSSITAYSAETVSGSPKGTKISAKDSTLPGGELCADIQNVKEYSDCAEWQTATNANLSHMTGPACEKRDPVSESMKSRTTCMKDEFQSLREKETGFVQKCGGFSARKTDRTLFENCMKKLRTTWG